MKVGNDSKGRSVAQLDAVSDRNSVNRVALNPDLIATVIDKYSMRSAVEDVIVFDVQVRDVASEDAARRSCLVGIVPVQDQISDADVGVWPRRIRRREKICVGAVLELQLAVTVGRARDRAIVRV